MAKKEAKGVEKLREDFLSPEQIELRHQRQFLEAYNKLVEEYGYAIRPVIKLGLELVKLPKPQKDGADNNK